MRVVTLKLPEDLDRRLRVWARQHKTTRSAVLRAALDQYTGESRRSVTALAGDLVGCFKGPRDLSSSSRHLNGYGE